MAPETRHLKISGRVQGVGFRAAMRAAASRLGIAGWVCNRFDGSVEAMVQGSPEAVAAIIEWAKRGPGRVEKVEVTEGQGSYERFDTLGTR